jgi:hypothetical protein
LYLQDQHILFEAMCYFVESVVINVSQTYLPGGRRQPGLVVASDPATVAAILDRQEAMFSMLLDLHFGDPVMITHLAKLMECFSRLIGLRKNLAVLAIQKVPALPQDMIRVPCVVRCLRPRLSLQRAVVKSFSPLTEPIQPGGRLCTDKLCILSAKESAGFKIT